METTYYAQPYDMDATGFYFHDYDDYTQAVSQCRNRYGQAVEEFEIQFIDGEALDAALFTALGINQANLRDYINTVDAWSETDKIKLIIAVGECGYAFDIAATNADDLEIDLYQNTNYRDLAQDFVDEGLFGEIPDHLAHYIDYEAIARDLQVDYADTVIAGTDYIYRMN